MAALAAKGIVADTEVVDVIIGAGMGGGVGVPIVIGSGVGEIDVANGIVVGCGDDGPAKGIVYIQVNRTIGLISTKVIVLMIAFIVLLLF
jgi:hypothetical protein